jgi:hypothetical protein
MAVSTCNLFCTKGTANATTTANITAIASIDCYYYCCYCCIVAIAAAASLRTSVCSTQMRHNKSLEVAAVMLLAFSVICVDFCYRQC